MLVLGTVAGIILLWSMFSRPLERRGITAAMVFMLAGLAVGASALRLVDIRMQSEVAVRVAEFALVLLLFSDAMRLDLRSRRHQLAWPARLVLVGLPLTLLVGTGVGLVVFPEMALASVFLLATMLAMTDTALAQKAITDESVPVRVRHALDLESGLMDGVAVPFFLVALDLANAELHGGVSATVLRHMGAQIGWGMFGGVAAGVAGGLLFRFADGRGWLGTAWRQILPLATALIAFAAAVGLGGSGFVAAFVGGMVFGVAAREHGAAALFTEETGDLLAAAVWIGFGALALGPALSHVTWRVVLYAVLSLTVVRMVPVAVAMLGRGARLPTVAFLGWFGPRGLPAVVFGLLVIGRGVPEQATLSTTVIVTVALSVILHALTSAPLAARYRRWYERHVAAEPQASEAEQVSMPRPRRDAVDRERLSRSESPH